MFQEGRAIFGNQLLEFIFELIL